MKNLVLILTISFCVSVVNVATAQLTKQEKKEWKKKLKKTTPEQFKRMYDENAALKSEASSTQGQLSSIQASIGEKDAKIAELTEQNRKMEAQVNAAKKAIAKAKQEATAAPATTSAVSEDGVVFKVQIGAFRNKDLSKYFENNENFGGETEADGVQKITLGNFRDYWEADTFKKYLREMGVNDAWIVPYKDGTRVAMKDVLEGVVQ
jgi:hypothetical protein